jgi:hypothetical protein
MPYRELKVTIGERIQYTAQQKDKPTTKPEPPRTAE